MICTPTTALLDGPGTRAGSGQAAFALTAVQKPTGEPAMAGDRRTHC
jgi:hypothetical protein